MGTSLSERKSNRAVYGFALLPDDIQTEALLPLDSPSPSFMYTMGPWLMKPFNWYHQWYVAIDRVRVPGGLGSIYPIDSVSQLFTFTEHLNSMLFISKIKGCILDIRFCVHVPPCRHQSARHSSTH
jgi:hypothetical protein